MPSTRYTITGFRSVPGGPPFKPKNAAYDELMKGLWMAAENFRNEGDGGIEGAKLACRAVARFIAVRHVDPELAAPFLALHAAFEDLERGIQPELFSTDVSQKRRSRSSQRQYLQLLASVLLDVLIHLGDRKDQAASKVARHV